jgi:hypothetical protein
MYLNMVDSLCFYEFWVQTGIGGPRGAQYSARRSGAWQRRNAGQRQRWTAAAVSRMSRDELPT